MNCRRSEELWGDNLDGALPEPLAMELRSHLATCESCAELSSLYREIVFELRGLSDEEPSAGLAERVLARTRPELSRHRGANASWTARAPRKWAGAPAWLAVAAVLTLVLISRPPTFLSDLSRQTSQSVHQIYSFGVRTYHRAGRWVEDLNVLRMTVGVAFEDRIDRLSERLRELEEARRRSDDSESSNSEPVPIVAPEHNARSLV